MKPNITDDNESMRYDEPMQRMERTVGWPYSILRGFIERRIGACQQKMGKLLRRALIGWTSFNSAQPTGLGGVQDIGSVDMVRSIRILSVMAIAATVISCSSIVKRPDIESVKNVAIVSVFGNELIREIKGSAWVRKSEVVTGFSRENRVELANFAAAYVRAELNKTRKFKVLDPQKVVASAIYQDATRKMQEFKDREGKTISEDSLIGKVGQFMTNFANLKFFSATGMIPMPLHDVNGNTDPERVQKLGQLAKDLGVEGVVVVHIDLAYTGGALSLGGTGTAVASVATSLNMVDKKGIVVINFPAISERSARFESETSSFMSHGRLIFNAKLEQMLHEAFVASFDNTLSKIKKEL